MGWDLTSHLPPERDTIRRMPASGQVAHATAPPVSPVRPSEISVQERGCLLDYDPDLGTDMRKEELVLARRWLHVKLMRIGTGSCDLGRVLTDSGATAALIVTGLLVRRVSLAGRAAAEPLGPGDLIARPPTAEATHPILMPDVAWSCESPAALALLPERLMNAVPRWPALGQALERRMLARTMRLATLHAIAQIPRAESRLYLLLWLLAERFGRVTSDGVVLDVAPRYRLIGELIGARRSTVSLAMKELRQRGLVSARADGRLLLPEGRPAGPLAPIE